MKKAFALVVLIVTPSIVFAQGTMFVVNNATSLVQAWASNWDHSLSPAPAGGARVQFLAAPSGTAFTPLGRVLTTGSVQGFEFHYPTMATWLARNPGWNAYGTASIAPVAGRFNVGIVTVSPLTSGGNIEYVVIGWTGPSATLDGALLSGEAYIGQSALYTSVATGDPTTTPIPGIPTALTATFAGLTLVPQAYLPEPSTFAVTGLGAVMLLLFRQRGK